MQGPFVLPLQARFAQIQGVISRGCSSLSALQQLLPQRQGESCLATQAPCTVLCVESSKLVKWTLPCHMTMYQASWAKASAAHQHRTMSASGTACECSGGNSKHLPPRLS